jgi:hypothetical protein
LNIWKVITGLLGVVGAALLGGALSSYAATPATPAAIRSDTDTYYLLVFNQPVAGQETEYNDWYDHQHAPDVVSVPGFVSARRYVLAEYQLRPPALIKPRYVVIYKIVTADLSAVYAEVNRRIRSGETRMSRTLDMSSGENYTYRVFRPRLMGSKPDNPEGATGVLQDYVQLVFADPADGLDAEFNNWYDRHHAPDVLTVPGFVSGQRLTLADVQLVKQGTPQQYLTMFDIRSSDLKRTLADFVMRAPGMSNSPAFDGKRVFGYTYRALGLPLDGDAIRTQRAAGR